MIGLALISRFLQPAMLAAVFPTNCVVASCVVLVPTDAVGAAGVPVNVGDAKAARPKFAVSSGPTVTQALLAPLRILSRPLAVSAQNW